MKSRDRPKWERKKTKKEGEAFRQRKIRNREWRRKIIVALLTICRDKEEQV